MSETATKTKLHGVAAIYTFRRRHIYELSLIGGHEMIEGKKIKSVVCREPMREREEPTFFNAWLPEDTPYFRAHQASLIVYRCESHHIKSAWFDVYKSDVNGDDKLHCSLNARDVAEIYYF